MALADQAIRLRRTKWMSNADLLAQELYVILLTDTAPQTGPTALDTGNGASPLQFDTGLLADPLSGFVLPDFQLPPDSNQGNAQETPVDQTDPRQFLIRKRVKTQFRNVRAVLPGKITAGSNGVYEIDVYPNGTTTRTNKTAPIVHVTGVLQLPSGQTATVAAGTWVVVFRYKRVQITTTTQVETGPGIEGEKPVQTKTEVKVVASEDDFITPAGTSFPGVVVSGTGATYQVNVYLTGLANPPTLVTVTQLQIDANETIPAGTSAIVIQSGGQFVMQVPVWL